MLGLSSIANLKSRVLVLGVFPGEESLRRREYYADSRNSFWTVACTALGVDVPQDYHSRVDLLRKSKIAVWDVLRSCERIGSQDKGIKPGSETFNRIGGFLSLHKDITTICFNGWEAYGYFSLMPKRKSYQKMNDMALVVLPSSSGSNTHQSIEQKSELWKVAIRDAKINPCCMRH